MDILATLKSALDVTKLWMARAWGTQTRDQSTVEHAIAHAREQKSIAFEALTHARTDEDIRAALVTVNHWDDELTRLYREAAAKWP